MDENRNLLIVLGEWWERRRTAALERAQPQCPGRIRRVLRWFTPNGGMLLLAVVLILTQQVWARPLATPAAPGPSANTVNYQGKLANPDGTPVTDNTYAMSFSLWDASTGGSVVWGPEDHAVPVSDGLFSVGLGSKNPILTSVWNGDRYLEIAVGGETLSPRELIRSVPIAGMALTVPPGVLGPANFTPLTDEAVDTAMRSTTSTSFANFGSTTLSFNLPYRAMVYLYVRSSVRNPSGRSAVTLNIDGQDHFGGQHSLYVETNSTEWLTMGAGAPWTLDAGAHTIRPRFGSLDGTIAWAANVSYGYIVLGQAP
jgi:hypothetical protein